MFFTSGISGFTAVHRCKITSVPNVNTDHFQLKQQMLDSLAVEHVPKEWVTVNIHYTSCHPFSGDLACNKPYRFCPLPELAEASLLFGVPASRRAQTALMRSGQRPKQ